MSKPVYTALALVTGSGLRPETRSGQRPDAPGRACRLPEDAHRQAVFFSGS